MQRHHLAVPADTDSTSLTRGRQADRPVATLAQVWQDLMQDYRLIFKQHRSFARLMLLALGLVFAFARRTVTQAICAIGQDQADWSGWYRLLRGQRFDEVSLWRVLVKQTVAHAPVNEPYVVAIDTTAIWRSSHSMPGSGWACAPQTAAFRRGLRRAQRFLTCAWLPEALRSFSRAIPIRLLSAFTPSSAPALDGPRKAWQAALECLRWLRETLDSLGRVSQPLVALADGAFDQVELWRQLPVGVTLVTRTARNRVLYELPPAPTGGRGRRRKYGARTLTPQMHLHARGGWQQTTIEIRGRQRLLRYKLIGPLLRQGAPERPLFLLVVQGQSWRRRGKRHARLPAYYLVNAAWDDKGACWRLPLPATSILQLVWQRWEIEVTHRAMKTGFGVGEMQCWQSVSAVLSVQVHAWVFSTLMLAAYCCWGMLGRQRRRCAWDRHAQRWTFNTVLQELRAELWMLKEFRASCLASAATEAKIPTTCLWLIHSALSCLRG